MGSKNLSLALKIVFGVVFAAAVFAASYNAFMDLDTWRHVALGKEFMKDLGFPPQDNFSYTGQAAWDKSSWLFDIFSYSACYLAGIGSLLYMKFFLAVMLISVLFFIIFKKQQGRYISVTIPFGLAALVILDHYFRVTPLAFSCVFTVYFIFVLEQQPSKKNMALYYSLPFIALFWANMDRTVPAAAVLTLIYLLYYAADYLEMPEKRESYYFLPALVAFAGVAGASLLNPSSYHVYTGLISGFKTGASWWVQAFTAQGAGEKGHLALLAAYIISLLVILFFNERGADVGRKSELLKDLCVPGALLAACFSDRQYIPVFITATIPLFMYYAYLIFRWSFVWPRQWTEKDLLRIKNILYIALIPIVAAYTVYNFTEPKKKYYPDSALGYILSAKVPKNLYAPASWAGYLEYYLYPSYGVMWDGNPNRPEEARKDYAEINNSILTVSPLIRKYSINSFLLPSKSGLADRLKNSMGYRVAYFDDNNVVLVNPELDRDHLKYIHPEQPVDFYDKANYSAALKELSDFAEKYPSVRAHVLLGRLYAAGATKNAKTYLEDTISNFPDEYELYAVLGKIYYDEGEFPSAIDVWEQSPKLDEVTGKLLKAARKKAEKVEE